MIVDHWSNSLLNLKVIHIERIIYKSGFFTHLIEYCNQLEEVYLYLSERDLIMMDLLYNLIVNQCHLKKSQFFFVCTIALFATDSEKIFINDIDEKIFSTVYEIIRGKIYN